MEVVAFLTEALLVTRVFNPCGMLGNCGKSSVRGNTHGLKTRVTIQAISIEQ